MLKQWINCLISIAFTFILVTVDAYCAKDGYIKPELFSVIISHSLLWGGIVFFTIASVYSRVNTGW